MEKAFSVANLISKKFDTLPFDGKWLDATGLPEPHGTWMIYGASKQGKTSFAMMLCKYLDNFRRVCYDSIEEGLSLSIRKAVIRAGLGKSRVVFVDKENVEELTARLSRHKSPDVIVVDSVQFAGITVSQYKALKRKFSKKLFIYISHVKGYEVDGAAALFIKRDASVLFHVDHFRAFPTSRYGGGKYIDIDAKKAALFFGEVEPT